MASFPSLSSSVSATRWKHEVFISFRGEDTRNNFIDHLYSALVQKGLYVFKDDKALHKGQQISRELLKAIEESRFAVVVFSKHYGDSTWCLDELVKIMECQIQKGQTVFPVFYHVEPSHVRRQKRKFYTAFQQHEETFRGEMEKVDKWRKALAAAGSLSGWTINKEDNRGESDIITQIVEKILGSIPPRGMEKNLIGIGSRIDELYPLICMESREDVRTVGILGMGGIGKTTIAKVLFRRIAHNFEGSSFIEEVSKNSSSSNDIWALQKKMLTDVLVTTEGFHFAFPEDGASMIEERFFNKKVLLVLDDVDDVKQLEFLAATHDWFGAGSRIIITTRDKHLLRYANAIYEPDFFRENEAVELFCRHAFRTSTPSIGYEDLSYRAIRYASCLPLALKVLGAFFRGMTEVGDWESALERLREESDDNFHDILKLSFDGLKLSEKRIFLDIACFYKGKEVEHVTRVLDSFGFHPVIGICVLMQKSLITISNKRLDMHDLIQEMGRKIVHDWFLDSRLWQLEQIHDLVKGNKKEKTIEAITCMQNVYNVDDYNAKLGLSVDVFRRMKKLRLLDIDWSFTSTQPTFLPDELRWLRWNDYPFLFLPLADMCKLVGLEMAAGDIRHLWNGRKILPNLKFIHLESMGRLTSFPDVSGAPNIERLTLLNCVSLVEVDESLGYHARIVYLDMNGCSSLTRLPSMLEMESLETLILSGCENLKRFPQVSQCMVRLSKINLYSCSRIKKLPSSIKYLSNLSFLNLTNCGNLKKLPSSICELQYLKNLDLHNCVKLKRFPVKPGSMNLLEELWLGFSGETPTKVKKCGLQFIDDLGSPRKSVGFHGLTNLSSLRKLNLSWREIKEESFPKNLNAFSSLEELYLCGNSRLVHLPENISHLPRLKRLELSECKRLRTLCGLPSSIQVLKANNCTSLKQIGNLSKEGKWLYKIWLINCDKLLEDEKSERYLEKMLQLYFIQKCAAVNHRLSITIPGSKIPSWFKKEKHGCRIELNHKWNTRITGFVVCVLLPGVYLSPESNFPRIIFQIVSDGKVVRKPEFDYIMDTSETGENGNVWMTYIPLGFFQQMYKDLQPEDWAHIEGILHMTVMTTYRSTPLRCGAHVIYKEDVQQVSNCISDYGNLMHVNDENLGYDEIISGSTYAYEEKSDDKSLTPFRSRTSTRRITKSISYSGPLAMYPFTYLQLGTL